MASVYDMFGTNIQDEEDGRWLYHGDEKLDTTPAVKLRFMGGPNTKSLEAVKAEEYAAYEDVEIDEDHPAAIRVFVRTVVVEWRNMPSSDAPTAFSVDAAVKLLIELPHMRRIWINWARNIRNFQDTAKKPNAKQVAKTRKN
jgi:hypothetical protein